MSALSLRQQEIIDTALDIISEKGLENFTIKNLAKARGVSEPALYRHFDSKENILVLILSRYRNGIFDLLEIISEKDVLPYEKIEFFYLEILRRFSDSPALSSIIFSDELFMRNNRLSREASSIMMMMHDGIERILKAAKSAGVLTSGTPCGELSWIIMGAIHMTVARWRLSGYSYDPVPEGKKMLRVLKKLIFIQDHFPTRKVFIESQ